MKVFKIRHKQTGLFSTGRLRPTWAKQGKIWQRINYVHSHINRLTNAYTAADVYKDAEIVEAEITELLTPVEDVKDVLIKAYDRVIAHNEDRIARNDDNYGFARENLESARERKAIF
jgi:hypothetical protein